MTAIWAHRGASAYAPENTLPAFELAVTQGAEGVEFDVQLSADQVPVVIHDETVDRTTNGHGWVRDLTLAQLRSLIVRPEPAGPDQAIVRIPTLDEVLDLLAPTSLTINIELKNSIVVYPGLEEKILDAVAVRGLADRVVLSSFNHYSLAHLQSLGTACELAVLFSDPLFRVWDYVRSLGLRAVHPPFPLVFVPGFLDGCRTAGLTVRPWSVNSVGDLRAMFAAGVDAVFTDHPDIALAERARPA